MVDRKTLPIVIVTGFWGFVGIICPILIQLFMRRSPNKGYCSSYVVLTMPTLNKTYLFIFIYLSNSKLKYSILTLFMFLNRDRTP